jgi:hypothetical protein
MNPIFEPYWSSYLKQFDEDRLPNSSFQSIPGPGKTNKFCVIVETRTHPLLHLVCRNFMALLQSKGWGLIVFQGTANKESNEAAFKDWKEVVFFSFDFPELGHAGYGDLLRSSEFWKMLKGIGCEHALIFQVDCILRKDTVDEYLQYDYVGAPWSIQPNRVFFDICTIGNGGLSLRNVNTMIEIVEKYKSEPFPEEIIPGYAEDKWFCYWLTKEGYKLPSYEKAKEFAVETVFYEDPIGLHSPYIMEFASYWDYVHLLKKRF